MRVLAVPSKSLLDVRWINASIRTFSPREFLGAITGIISLIAAFTGKAHPILAVFGILVIVFGFLPFGFLTPEKQMIAFLSFRLKGNGSKKQKKQESSLIGIGIYSEMIVQHVPKPADTPQTIQIENLEIPYTLKIKTLSESQFVPVSIFFAEESGENQIHVSNTVTDRHGNVSCTILLESYGHKRVRVIDEASHVLYDKMILFERK